MNNWRNLVTFRVEGKDYSYGELKSLQLSSHSIVRCKTSDKSVLMTLGEVLRPDEECRAMPTASEIRSDDAKFLDVSSLFGTNPGRPGELVRLNRNDKVPIAIDVVPLDSERAKRVIQREEGWTLRNASNKCGGEEYPIPVRLDSDGNVRYLGCEFVMGKWSVSKTSGFAIWQQPSCWGMICRREVTQRLHIRLQEGGKDMYLVLLFDKTTGKHYLQQDCSFYMKVNGVVKMADIMGKSAWSAE
jgi:hypothetical protein